MTSEERAFKAGWHQGLFDGNPEHGCGFGSIRSAESAWTDYQRGHLVQVYDKRQKAYVDCVPRVERGAVRPEEPKNDC